MYVSDEVCSISQYIYLSVFTSGFEFIKISEVTNSIALLSLNWCPSIHVIMLLIIITNCQQ